MAYWNFPISTVCALNLFKAQCTLSVVSGRKYNEKAKSELQDFKGLPLMIATFIPIDHRRKGYIYGNILPYLVLPAGETEAKCLFSNIFSGEAPAWKRG